MNDYGICFRIVSADEAPTGDEIEAVAEKLMDYFLNAGHDVVASTNGETFEIELDLPEFRAESEHEAVRIASEMLTSAGAFAGVEIRVDRQPQHRESRNVYDKLSTLVSA